MENNLAPKDIRGIPDEVIQEQLQNWHIKRKEIITKI